MTAAKVADRRRSSAAHVRAILDNALDAVAVMDDEGRVTYWNPQAERSFGWSRDDAIGRELAELVLLPDDRATLRTGIGRFLESGEETLVNRRLEMRGRRRDLSVFPIELTITPIREGRSYAFGAFARDISERKRGERERERLLADAERARAQAETASRVKDEFLATLSHELRTPLTAIVGWIYLLRGGRLDVPTTAKGLAAIERNAAAQSQVISDIIDLSRIVGARFRLNVEPVRMAPIVAAAIDTLLPAAKAKAIKVQPILDPEAGPVSGDADRLRQVVWNLVSNAVKFTPPEGNVTVRLERDDPNVRLTVEDTGVGIDPAFLPHVFERFRQADSSNTRTHGGLGLGLAVVRHLVELHGGTVEARSPGPGEGATFIVEIPLLTPDQLSALGPERDMAAVTGCTGFTAEETSLSGVKVLLVDEGEDVREVIGSILRDAGAEVTAVGSARDALEAFVRDRPHVIISEVEMEGESGYSLLRKIRALPAGEGGLVPAAALSSRSRSEDRVQVLLAGFQIHLSKPIQPAELVAVVASLTGRNSPA